MTTERIEELYKNGNITFAEAIELGMKGKTDEHNSPVENKILTKEEYLNNFVEHCLDEIHIENEHEGEIIPIIDIDKIVKYMLFTDWKWRGETVTREEIVKTIKSLVREAVEYIIRQVETETGDSDENYEANIEAGGFRVEAWFEHNETREIYVRISFVPENGETEPFNFDQYEKMLLF